MRLKIILPLLVLLLALAGAFALVATRETVAPQPLERRLPSVLVTTVQPRTLELQVRSQGTVMPRTESQLIPEVAGPVVWTAPSLASGGYFEEGDPLVRIDRSSYMSAVQRAEATVARRRGEHEYALAELERHQRLIDDLVVSENRFEETKRAMSVASAQLQDALAALDEAQRDLRRTEIRAPFRGRVRDETVDVGQFVNRGTPVATLYATDYLEVRLPVPDDQLAYFDVPLWERGTTDVELPKVRLHTRFAGEERTWRGRVVRTEGEIDPMSRMVHVVARVENLEGFGGSDTSPLPVGLFVHANIQASTVDGVYVLPRSTLWDSVNVVVADDENRLRVRAVDILRVDGDEVVIANGLAPGERVCVTPPGDLIEGQLVDPYADGGEVDS